MRGFRDTSAAALRLYDLWRQPFQGTVRPDVGEKSFAAVSHLPSKTDELVKHCIGRMALWAAPDADPGSFSSNPRWNDLRYDRSSDG